MIRTDLLQLSRSGYFPSAPYTGYIKTMELDGDIIT